MSKAYIGIGTNLGDKEKNIKNAVRLLKEKCEIIKSSPLYKTEPVGFKNQDWFINCVIEARTKLAPYELLHFLKDIEKSMGRAKAIKYGPRIIDLDILYYGDLILKEKNLTIPHPRMHKRLFILAPLVDISPDFIHPKLKKGIKALIADLKQPEKVELYSRTKLIIQ